MDNKESIIRVLGLQDVVVEDFRLYQSALCARLVVRQRRESAMCCECGSHLGRVHEWVEKQLKAPPLGVYQIVYLRFFQLRAFCETCRANRMAKVDWVHPEIHTMTCGFAEVAGRLMEEITCEAVGRILHCESGTLWRLDQWRMQLMLTRYEFPKNIDVSHLSADEVHFRTERLEERYGLWAKRWAPAYLTNLVCYKEGKVLWNASGRGADSLSECLDILTPKQKRQVKYLAVDMHEPYLSIIQKDLPNATPVIDRFHLAKQINEAFDSVRKAEFKKARENHDDFTQDMLHPHRRFILVSREKDLSNSELKLLLKLRKINQPIHDAMLIVEFFHKALDKNSVESFRTTLKNWLWLVRESKLKPFRRIAKLIRKYRPWIENYIRSGLSCAVSEGLNNKIKTLKRMGYGYTNEDSFRRKILQRCGYLNHHHINTNAYFFKVLRPVF